jgi:hypothetical protein
MYIGSCSVEGMGGLIGIIAGAVFLVAVTTVILVVIVRKMR